MVLGLILLTRNAHEVRWIRFLSDSTLALYLYHPLFQILAAPYVTAWHPLARIFILVLIVLLDNAHLGLVRQWQELFFDGNYSEVELSDNPDFAVVAKAFSVDARTVDKRKDVQASLEWLLASEGPALLHVLIDSQENVWPLVPPGKANHEMMTAREIGI